MTKTRMPLKAVWPFYAVAWLSIGAINLAAYVANGLVPDLAIRNAIAYLLPDALLGLFVLQLPQRLPWSEHSVPRIAALHMALLVLFVALSTLGWMAMIQFDRWVFHATDSSGFSPRLLPWRIANDLFVYATCCGLGYAWQHAASARVLATQVAQAEALRAKAQLEVMRSQLNPHFVLNTLHALIGLVGRDPALAEDALERLGDLLRYSLTIQRQGTDEVALRDEWAFVQNFVAIERLRLGSRLRTKFDVEESVLDCSVPTFSLQTLVENAIMHAVAPSINGGTIEVRVRPSGTQLHIEVVDEGSGRTSASRSEHFGVGLRLLRERLAALYQTQASLDLQASGGGTRAVLHVPLRLIQSGLIQSGLIQSGLIQSGTLESNKSALLPVSGERA